MEINTTYLVLTIIGTGLTFFWLILYFKGRNKYDAYINALRSDEYFMKDFYFIGYEMMNLFKVEFRDKYSNSREKKMSEVKGKKYAQFYIMANLAAELTYLLTFSVVGFLLAAITKEPLLSGMGIVLSLLMIYYTENVLSQKVSKRHETMMVEYPHVLSQMALLINAGMTLRETVEVIASKGDGPLTTEFKQMVKDMNNGIPDAYALKALADRCEIAEIRKLSNTILQNIQKGGNELAKSLIDMSNEVWKARISKSREAAEKASAKLLMPIMLIFAGILLMVMVPMFINMSL